MSEENKAQVIDSAPPAKTNGLSIRLAGGLVTLIALICGVSFYVIWFQARPLLSGLSEHDQVQLGQNITLALGQELGKIEGIAQSMSSVAMNLPKDPSVFHNVFPSILNQLGEDSVIAGGGVWPEEFAFNSSKSRYSFFWGRDKDGKLKFYNDYNETDGGGYHNEEWYVPARLLPANHVYWSRSYTDPYSLQPMVTCTAPMLKAGRFIGVTTVDLMLDGVSGILAELVDSNSYAFVVDRNNKFISFPEPKLVLTHRKEAEKLTPDFIYVGELAENQPVFAQMADKLDALEYKQFMSIRESHSDHAQYVKNLAASSYQIHQDEAQRIASHLWSLQYNPSISPAELTRFTLSDDLMFKEPVTVVVFQMPMTNWKVVTVFRQSFSELVTNSIIHELVISILVTVIGFGGLAFIALNSRVLKRLKTMTHQLRLAVESNSSDGLQLKYNEFDEIGALVYWFNRRSLQMDTARIQAEKANKVKSDFLEKMSHEFKAPLNSIIGFSRRLMFKLEGSLESSYNNDLNVIYRSALHQLDLVNGILDHSALEAGGVELNLFHESVNDIVDTVMEKMQEFVIGANLEFKIKKLDQDKKIYCDKIKICQALCNLLASAVKATNIGFVSLSVEDSVFDLRSSISFIITDSGVGISIGDQEKLFRPFNKLDDQTPASGAGLGIFLARYFVSLHAGEITLQSNSTVELGSIFTIHLPLSGPVI